MTTRPIRSHKLKDRHFGGEWHDRIVDRWDYDDMLADPRWRKDWISFDGVVHHAGTDRVYCGITSFDADIFKAFDRRQGKFVDLGFKKVGNKYDAKFHRSMQLTKNGKTLYTATALLHDIDRFWDAPGGGIYRHETASGKTVKLGIPIPHNYIQSIALDEKRGVIYSMHFTPERLSRFDLETRKARDLGPLGSGFGMAQGENVLLDDDGCAWCSWGLTRAWQPGPGADCYRLCKFDPRKNKIVYFDRGLPRADAAYGNAKVECLFNLGTGCLYASGDNGSLFRINTQTARATYLGTPIRDRRSRLTSLMMHKGCAYGITGRDGKCRLLRFDPKTETYELGREIVDQNGEAMFQCHDVTVTPDGVLFAGENDHPRRSGYLWEVPL
jgi:hypothetical protein